MKSNEYVQAPKSNTIENRRIARYRLNVVQNPVRARCCGFGEKDRRPLDPPPIVELIAEDMNGVQLRLNPTDTILLVAHCELFSQDKQTNQTLVYTPWTTQSFSESSSATGSNNPQYTRNLMGATVSNVYHLNDQQDNPGTYFIFHDLSIRTEGTFTLKFTFVNISDCQDNINNNNNMYAKVVTNEEVFTEPFSVFSAKKFPGLTESTALSRCFSKQGIKIPIRNDTPKRSLMTIPLPPSNSISTNIVSIESSSTSSSSSASSPPIPSSITITNTATTTTTTTTTTTPTTTTIQPERGHHYTRLPISDFLIPEQ